MYIKYADFILENTLWAPPILFMFLRFCSGVASEILRLVPFCACVRRDGGRVRRNSLWVKSGGRGFPDSGVVAAVQLRPWPLHFLIEFHLLVHFHDSNLAAVN